LIREAEAADQKQISELYRMLVPHSRKRNVLAEQIERIKMDPNHFLLVYDEEGILLGTLTLNICLLALHGLRPYGVIENIVVHEHHRGRGVGQKLLQYAEDSCRSLDCHRIMLLSSSKRQMDHQFFEREGYDGAVSRGFRKYL
jgi:N-acetylglutamate synthase-like GNAT family acetyltransferase